MGMGFSMSTRAGISICIDDMEIPESKREIIQRAEEEVLRYQSRFNNGYLTENEKYNHVVDLWTNTTNTVAKNLFSDISVENIVDEYVTKCYFQMELRHSKTLLTLFI